MPITDQTAQARPPQFHVHRYDAEVDDVDDLNAWAVSLWSPLYTTTKPAFLLDGTGQLHASVGNTFTTAVPDGFWIVFGMSGGITVMAETAFQTTYELDE